MTVIFDGKSFAKDKEEIVLSKVKELKQKGVVPKLVVVATRDDEASLLYLSLKKKAAERLGIEFELYKVGRSKHNKRNLVMSLTRELSRQPATNGYLLQLPLSRELKPYTKNILDLIAPERDVDGLGENSPFNSGVVSAVLQILEVAKRELNIEDLSKLEYLVVGSEGFVGKSIFNKLQSLGYKVTGEDKFNLGRNLSVNIKTSADVVISATGIHGLIKGHHIKEGAIVIDVGAPRGDVVFENVSKRASFITPVPGGVGPVTIACLFENFVMAIEKQLSEDKGELAYTHI